MEGSVRVQLGFRPNAAAVLLDDPLHGRQSDPGSSKVFGTVQPLEDSKELVRVFHIETHAIIANEDDGFAILKPLADADNRKLAQSSELHCVGEQVGKNCFHQNAIAVDDREGVKNLFDLPTQHFRFQFLNHFPCQ